MDKLLTLWTGSGLFNMTAGQAVMIAVGLLLLYLAIRKGFEPLLLVPIGFGGILANIPEAGLALSAAENAIHFAKPEVLAALAGILDVSYQAGQAVTPEVVEVFKHAYKEASTGEVSTAIAAAQDFGYTNG
ncbi:sodium ion-translocating decarboxylase subunit beta, partial [Marinobacter subterrani]